VFGADTVKSMFLVEIDLTLGSERRLADDEITDIIESVVDDLDRLPIEPSVGTSRVGDHVHVTVGVTVDEEEEFDALAFGVAAVKAAFHAAGVGTAGLVVPRDLRSRVVPLQPV
jgi:hypothetical protein